MCRYFYAIQKGCNVIIMLSSWSLSTTISHIPYPVYVSFCSRRLLVLSGPTMLVCSCFVIFSHIQEEKMTNKYISDGASELKGNCEWSTIFLLIFAFFATLSYAALLVNDVNIDNRRRVWCISIFWTLSSWNKKII